MIVHALEKEHGTIPPGALVIGYTGWSQKWSDPVAYCKIDVDGMMHFPVWSPEAAELLVERTVVGIGIDTLSPNGGNTEFRVHKLALGVNKYILENIANLDQLPAKGMYALVMPLKIAWATEAPVRLMAFI